MFVNHLPAERLSAFSSVSGNKAAYSSPSIKSLTLRPKLTARSAVWVASIIFSLGFLPNKYAGNKCDANSDFVCLGGILIIKRLSLPVAISSKAFAILT